MFWFSIDFTPCSSASKLICSWENNNKIFVSDTANLFQTLKNVFQVHCLVPQWDNTPGPLATSLPIRLLHRLQGFLISKFWILQILWNIKGFLHSLRGFFNYKILNSTNSFNCKRVSHRLQGFFNFKILDSSNSLNYKRVSTQIKRLQILLMTKFCH